MKKNYKSIISLILITTLLFTACQSPFGKKETKKPQKPAISSNRTFTEQDMKEQKAFDKYTETLFIDILSESSLSVHSFLSFPEKYGLDDAPNILGDPSLEAYEEDLQKKDGYLNELSGFNYASLTDEQQLTYDILKTEFEDTKKGKDFYWFSNYFSPMSGVQTGYPSFFGQFEINREKDVIDYLELIKQFPTFFNDLISYQEKKTEKGMGMPDYQIDKVIDQCEEFISDADNHFLITTFNDRINALSDISDAQKQEYSEQNSQIVKEIIIPTYKNLIDKLTLLKGKAVCEGGLSNFDNGKEAYEYLVRSYTCTDKSVDEIKDLLEENYTSDLASVLTIATMDPDIYDKSCDYPINTKDCDGVIEYLIDKIKDDFPSGYNTEYTVNDVPKSIEKYDNPAYYYVPHIDNTSRNNIYINRYETYADLDLYPVLAHEAFPGHMYQTTYFQNKLPANIRHLLRYDGYIEGWGLYAELYSYSLSGQKKSVVNFNVSSNCLTYDIYCLCDIGINYEGWTREDTIDFVENIGYEAEMGDEIFETMVENPGIYLAYYIGYLEYMELRKEAQKTLDKNFSMKEFHRFILDIGPCQFEILRNYFEIWLNEQK